MQTHRFTCEICGASAETERSWTGQFDCPRDWYAVTVERAKGWHTQNNIRSLGHGLMEYVDAFPGAGRWEENVTPPRPVHLDLCSEKCAFEAMRRLHEGAQITRFDGPLRLTAQEISYVLNYRANAEDVKTA